jgi:hypothetical protein
LGNLKVAEHPEDIHVNRIILERILGKQGGKSWTGFCGSGWGPVVDFCEHGNETSGFIEGGDFLEYLSDRMFPKMDPAPWS